MNKFAAFYEIQKFTAVHTTHSHWFLFLTAHSSHSVSLISILTLSSKFQVTSFSQFLRLLVRYGLQTYSASLGRLHGLHFLVNWIQKRLLKLRLLIFFLTYNDLLRTGRSSDRIPVGGEIFRIRSDRPWGPHRLLHNGYRVSFPGVKRPGCGVDHPAHSSAEVIERVELYLFSALGLRGLL